jgi:hypothetical protein
MNKPHTQETKEKIRLARLGQKLSASHKAKVILTLENGAGRKNPNWKGGRTFKNGYVMIRMPKHPNALSNGYVMEHRLVMEKSLKRILSIEEIVHHINGVRDDNRLENLVILTQRTHGDEHWADPKKRAERSELMKKIRKSKPWSTKKLK